jgi:hypothetical protein
MCILSLAESRHPEPVVGLWNWLLVYWTIGKIGLFGYAGYLLITADEEIESLKSSNESAERISREILNDSPKNF